MITIEQTATILAAMDEVFPVSSGSHLPQRLAVWQKIFSEWKASYQQVFEAVLQACGAAIFPPKPGEILAILNKQRGQVFMSDGNIWEKCLELARKHGTGGKTVEIQGKTHSPQGVPYTEGRLAANTEARELGIHQHVKAFGYERLCALVRPYNPRGEGVTIFELDEAKRDFLRVAKHIDAAPVQVQPAPGLLKLDGGKGNEQVRQVISDVVRHLKVV